MNDVDLSQAIEELMVARNPRDMQLARATLQPDYYLRAARILEGIRGTVIIGTGFPVTVLEAHIYAGGCAGTFYHQGFRFDAGATLAG